MAFLGVSICWDSITGSVNGQFDRKQMTSKNPVIKVLRSKIWRLVWVRLKIATNSGDQIWIKHLHVTANQILGREVVASLHIHLPGGSKKRKKVLKKIRKKKGETKLIVVSLFDHPGPKLNEKYEHV